MLTQQIIITRHPSTYGRHHLPISTGLFVSRLAVGRWLQAGDVIGQVYDGFDGELRHEVKAPIAGLLSGIRRQPLLFEGDLIARIQTRQAVSEGVDTYLHGQGQ